MMKKRWLALGLSAAMTVGLLSGCGGDSKESAAPGNSTAPVESAAAAGGSVYFLNFKPEQDEQWKEIAKAYTEATGVPVTVVTAASGQYETQLMAEMGKTEAPTLFQVNGPVGLNNWKDYCYDLSGSDIYKNLTSEDFALKNGDEVAAVAYVIETYGIIYNKALLEKAGYTQDDIQSFDDLKRVADDIQARKDELGVKGAFTSAGMDGSSDWRFKTHLANLPIYYEYKADGISSTDAIKGTFLDDYRQIWDLYITDATCPGSELSAKTGDDAVAEFAGGEAVFYQNGTWAYDDVKGLGDDNLGMLPIYIGADGEANQGLCTGSENYWCVNKNASPEDIQATLDFINWCVTSDEGTTAMAESLGFVIPFLAVGLFTGAVLGFFKRHQKVVRYTVKVGAALLILMGIMTLTGFMNGITSYLSTTGGGVSQPKVTQSAAPSSPAPSAAPEESASPSPDPAPAQSPEAEASPGASPAQVPAGAGSASPTQSPEETPAESPGESEPPDIPAPDFTLVDQNGNTHTLSDYKGKTVFLNFWATWCGPCQREMPEIQALYERYGNNEGDLVVLGVANPKTDEYPRNQDKSQEEVEQFLSDNGRRVLQLRDPGLPHHLHDRHGGQCLWLCYVLPHRRHDGEHRPADHVRPAGLNGFPSWEKSDIMRWQSRTGSAISFDARSFTL